MIALVTGAGVRGGKALALALGTAGYDLELCCHRSLTATERVAERVRKLGRKATVRQVDLADGAAVDALTSDLRRRHRRLDLLVHNAGTFARTPFPETTRTALAHALEVHVAAPFFLTQGLLPLLRAARAPSIVALGDIFGERPVVDFAAHCVSKAALHMLVRQLAVELAPKVRVNGIAPGVVLWPSEELGQGARDAALTRVPLAREGSPDDVARTVLFLAREAPFMTGQLLTLDGGRSVPL